MVTAARRQVERARRILSGGEQDQRDSSARREHWRSIAHYAHVLADTVLIVSRPVGAPLPAQLALPIGGRFTGDDADVPDDDDLEAEALALARRLDRLAARALARAA